MRKSLSVNFPAWLALLFALALAGCAPRRAGIFKQTPIQVTSESLYRDYKNEADANGKYLGKLLEVSGAVDQTGESTTGEPYVILHGGDPLGVVWCQFSGESQEQARRIKTGQTITLRGICLGKGINVMLHECRDRKSVV